VIEVNPDSTYPVFGSVKPGFESVRAAFIENLGTGEELGSGFAVAHGTQLVVDLWGGYTDESRTTLVGKDSLFNIWSTTKGLAATCIALLVDRKQLDYDSHVARYWPEFARNGKERVTLAQLMSHQAGLCGPREPVTIEDHYRHDPVAALLASQAPLFPPGSGWGYHTLTIGTLADELVRRVDGRTIGRFFADEVAGPLDLDIFLGLPAEHDHRAVKMIGPLDIEVARFEKPNAEAYRAGMENPALVADWANTRAWRAAGLAGAGGSSNARNLARLYATLQTSNEPTSAPRLVSPQTLATATRQQVIGIDQVNGEVSRYAMGYTLNTNGNMGPSQKCFGHAGWGGSVAFADPDRKLGIAYIMNRMIGPDWDAVDMRLTRLLRSTYAALSRGAAVA
jgi:CubicO group peptidase (beta-lactamase class C family)